MKPTQQQLNVDIKSTQPLKDSEGNHVLLAEGVLLRKVSKFLISSTEDGMIPLPVFYDIKSGKVLLESLPKELRDEYKEIGFSI